MTCELAERNRQKIGESSRVRKIIQRKTEKGRERERGREGEEEGEGKRGRGRLRQREPLCFVVRLVYLSSVTADS